jgi:hypothetical protein
MRVCAVKLVKDGIQNLTPFQAFIGSSFLISFDRVFDGPIIDNEPLWQRLRHLLFIRNYPISFAVLLKLAHSGPIGN